MCASYGLGGGSRIEPLDFAPFSDIVRKPQFVRWIAQNDGRARITGRRARNLNPVIRHDGGQTDVSLAWWSLPRANGGDAFNSRDDSLLRHWHTAFQRRALLPANWYDEGRKRWGLPGKATFAIAAITAMRIDDEGHEHLAYSMVTRRGVGEASTVVGSRGESRMPLVLPQELWADWLDPERPGDVDLVAGAQHASEEISRAMTSAEPRSDEAPETEAPTLF